MNNDPFKNKAVCIKCVHHHDTGNYPIVCTKHLTEVDYVYGSKHYEDARKHNSDGGCRDFEQGNPTYDAVNEELTASISTAMALLGAGRNETLVNAVRSMLSQADLLREINRQLNSANHKIRRMVNADDGETTVDAVGKFVAAFDPGSYWYFSTAALELTEAIGAPPPGPGRGWLKILEEVSELVRKGRSDQ